MIKLSDFRIGDGGSLVLLQLLTEESKLQPEPRGARRGRERNERRHQFASQALKCDRGGKNRACRRCSQGNSACGGVIVRKFN